MKLSEQEKKELQELAGSAKLQQEMRRLTETRHNPFVVNGKVDVDCLIQFLTEYNAFISHKPRPFRRIIDKDMRL